MSLAATMVWEVRTTGSDSVCSGGFNAARGGTDYTLQNAAQATGTVTSSTTTVTATTGIFTSVMVGNTITDGTTTKEITAFTSSTVVTVDSAPSWTAATIYVGGALASPGKAAGVAVGGNDVFLQSPATYAITSNSNNVASGKLSIAAGASAQDFTRLIGYATNRTDTNTDAKPVIQAGIGPSGTLATQAGNFVEIYNVDFDGNGKTVGAWSDSSSYCRLTRCSFHGFNGGVTTASMLGPGLVDECEFYGQTGGAQSVKTAGRVRGCDFHGNNGIPILANAGASITDCIIETTTGLGAAEGALYLNGNHIHADNVSIYSANTNGVYVASGWGTLKNVLVTDATTWGYNAAATTNGFRLRNCAGYNNTSGNVHANFSVNQGFVTLTAGPYSNAASGNFSLNATAGGGAACRAAGIPGTFPGGLTVGFPDIGAVQSAGGSGGGIIRVGFNGGFHG